MTVCPGMFVWSITKNVKDVNYGQTVLGLLRGGKVMRGDIFFADNGNGK